jgi:hypothetical protein
LVAQRLDSFHWNTTLHKHAGFVSTNGVLCGNWGSLK